jgi:hypothetical protein
MRFFKSSCGLGHCIVVVGYQCFIGPFCLHLQIWIITMKFLFLVLHAYNITIFMYFRTWCISHATFHLAVGNFRTSSKVEVLNSNIFYLGTHSVSNCSIHDISCYHISAWQYWIYSTIDNNKAYHSVLNVKYQNVPSLPTGTGKVHFIYI